jgi:ketosteroid isomerase-like protein
MHFALGWKEGTNLHLAQFAGGERTMRNVLWKVAVIIMFLASAPLRADDVRAAMEAANAQWLTAFNAPNPAAFPALYTENAVVLFQGAPPVKGPEAIGQFWAGRIKAGVKDHGFEILETWGDGKYAYQLARASAVLVKATGERTTFIGNTLSIFEKQNDGTWRTKVHMYNRPD